MQTRRTPNTPNALITAGKKAIELANARIAQLDTEVRALRCAHLGAPLRGRIAAPMVRFSLRGRGCPSRKCTLPSPIARACARAGQGSGGSAGERASRMSSMRSSALPFFLGDCWSV
jgi:hypothetical protein